MRCQTSEGTEQLRYSELYYTRIQVLDEERKNEIHHTIKEMNEKIKYFENIEFLLQN